MFVQRRFDFTSIPHPKWFQASRYEALHEIIDCNVGIGADEERVMHFKVNL